MKQQRPRRRQRPSLSSRSSGSRSLPLARGTHRFGTDVNEAEWTTPHDTRNVHTRKQSNVRLTTDSSCNLSSAYPGQVVLARVGHRERRRDVLPVDVRLVFHAQEVFKLGKVPSWFVHENERHEQTTRKIFVLDYFPAERMNTRSAAIKKRGCVYRLARTFLGTYGYTAAKRAAEIASNMASKMSSALLLREQAAAIPTPTAPNSLARKQGTLMGGARLATAAASATHQDTERNVPNKRA